MSDEDDEGVIAATQTELSFFMVLVFVLLMGFMASLLQSVAGDGEKESGGPEAAETGKQLSVPGTGRHADGQGKVKDGGGLEQQRSNCPKLVRAGNRFILRTDARSEALLFPIGSSSPTKELMQCLIEFCPVVIEEFKKRTGAIDHVRIEGHTSSVWKDTTRGCPEVQKLGQRPEGAALGVMCNMALSRNRAQMIFEWCRLVNVQHGIVSPEEYALRMIPIGRGPLNLKRDAAGREDEAASRRVEFVLVHRDEPDSASPPASPPAAKR